MGVWTMLLAAIAALVVPTAGKDNTSLDDDTATHVLFFLVDDLGFADVGYHGNRVGSAVITPAIDQLSADGVRLENYYVNFLCSPTRTSLMSGRYAYTIGMQAEVIVDGNPSCMPTSVATIADRLSAAGWATSAYGKWDIGMTTWGCTPTCRGFGHFFGFYNAFNDYFTHYVGAGLDLRNDTMPVRDLNGTYFTEAVTTDVVRWLGAEVKPGKSTFAYLAHESNHAPLEVPMHYIDGGCAAAIPRDRPARRIVCGMMRAVDASLANVTAAYKRLGVWDRTVIIMSTDNGGNTDTGGSNAPLRGNKATSYEGGVRGVGWVGGGLVALQRAAVSMAMIHVSDWYPTIVHGIAGLAVGIEADGHPALDGVDAWPSILSASAPSARTEMLLQLNPTIPGQLPMGAIRVGKYKLITGRPAVFGATGPTDRYGADHCASRDEHFSPRPGATFPYSITNATSPAFCPNGWVPPPEGGQLPVPPGGVGCEGTPCYFPNTPYTSGNATLLFDIEADPTEQHDLSTALPAVLDSLMHRLMEFVAETIPQDHSRTDPNSNPAHFHGVWTPWVGDPDPSHCAAPPPPPPVPCGPDGAAGDTDGVVLRVGGGHSCSSAGWCSGPAFSGAARTAQVTIDGKVIAFGLANASRKLAGPHGFALDFDCAELASGNHTVAVSCRCPNPKYPPVVLGAPSGSTNPVCTAASPLHKVPC